jgi:hypothetical protein
MFALLLFCLKRFFMRYSRFLRLSHTLIAAAVIFQLVISLIMDHPRTNKSMTIDGGLNFLWHEWVPGSAPAMPTMGERFRIQNLRVAGQQVIVDLWRITRDSGRRRRLAAGVNEEQIFVLQQSCFRCASQLSD